MNHSKLILIMYFIQPSMLTVFSLLRYVTLLLFCLFVVLIVKAHLHVNQLHFMYSIALHGQWLPSCTIQVHTTLPGFITLLLYLSLVTLFNLHFAPASLASCCYLGILGISCFRAFVPPVPSVWNAFPQIALWLNLLLPLGLCSDVTFSEGPPSPQHSLAFLASLSCSVFFTSWRTIYLYQYIFSLSPLEYVLHERRDFCEFCPLLYLRAWNSA